MVSAMISRAFGFDMEITAEQLLEINKSSEGCKYKDEEAEAHLTGTPRKKPLAESPFVRYLDYGSGKDRYLTYHHMIIQIEDCVDCLKRMCPQFDYELELDHSSGQNAERFDGISTTTMNLGRGETKEDDKFDINKVSFR